MVLYLYANFLFPLLVTPCPGTFSDITTALKLQYRLLRSGVLVGWRILTTGRALGMSANVTPLRISLLDTDERSIEA